MPGLWGPWMNLGPVDVRLSIEARLIFVVGTENFDLVLLMCYHRILQNHLNLSLFVVPVVLILNLVCYLV